MWEERSRILMEIFSSFSSDLFPEDFFWRDCTFLENDWFFDAIPFLIAFQVERHYRSIGHPNPLFPFISVFSIQIIWRLSWRPNTDNLDMRKNTWDIDDNFVLLLVIIFLVYFLWRGGLGWGLPLWWGWDWWLLWFRIVHLVVRL